MPVTKLLLRNFLILSFFLVSCKNKNASPWTGDCPMERLDWMEVSSGYDSKEVIELAGKIATSAKADASQVLKGSGDMNVKADFESSLRNTINSTSKQKIKVSQEFYEAYIKQRTGTCNIWKALHDGTLKSESAQKQAEEMFIKISSQFAQVQEEEKKRSPTYS